MMNAYGSYTLLEAIGRKKNLKILLAHLVHRGPRDVQERNFPPVPKRRRANFCHFRRGKRRMLSFCLFSLCCPIIQKIFLAHLVHRGHARMRGLQNRIFQGSIAYLKYPPSFLPHTKVRRVQRGFGKTVNGLAWGLESPGK